MTPTQRKRAPKPPAVVPPQGVALIYSNGRRVPCKVVAAGTTADGAPRWRVVLPAMQRRLPAGGSVEARKYNGGVLVVES